MADKRKDKYSFISYHGRATVVSDSQVTSDLPATSNLELNALKLEVKNCIKQIEKLRGEVHELKREVEATCREVDSTRNTIFKVTELLSYK